MEEIKHYIGGKLVSGTSGRSADVYNPATGEVQAQVPLASGEELNAAIAVAKEAQVGWAAQNPQKRGRVMMEFVRLLHRDMDKLAEALSREHGKTIPDAKGDVIRGLEVAEFCIGAPQMLKGEFSEGAGPGIDMHSTKQPLGVVAGITPFNFPAMIPMWKFCPRDCLWQCVHSQTFRARPIGTRHAGRVDDGSRAAGWNPERCTRG